MLLYFCGKINNMYTYLTNFVLSFIWSFQSTNESPETTTKLRRLIYKSSFKLKNCRNCLSRRNGVGRMCWLHNVIETIFHPVNNINDTIRRRSTIFNINDTAGKGENYYIPVSCNKSSAYSPFGILNNILKVRQW